MTSAADILRERAAVAAGQGRTRDMAIVGAVADLMVVLAAQDKCPCCGMEPDADVRVWRVAEYGEQNRERAELDSTWVSHARYTFQRQYNSDNANSGGPRNAWQKPSA